MNLGIKRRTNYKVLNMKFLKTMFDNWRLLFLFVMFSAGVICGAAVIKNTDNSVIIKLLEIFEGYRDIRRSQSMISTFSNSLLSSSAFLLFSYTAGLCAIGIPLVSVTPFFRGLGLGMISGYLYSSFALKGLGYCLLIIYPGTLISVIALLLSCNESLITSYDMFQTVNSSNSSFSSGSLRLYTARYIVFFSIAATGALLDAFFCKAFSGFFTF